VFIFLNTKRINGVHKNKSYKNDAYLIEKFKFTILAKGYFRETERRRNEIDRTKVMEELEEPEPASSPTPIPELIPSQSTWYSVYFAPDDECEQYMVGLINSAKSSVYAALYEHNAEECVRCSN
jgi:hypothetical protein